MSYIDALQHELKTSLSSDVNVDDLRVSVDESINMISDPNSEKYTTDTIDMRILSNNILTHRSSFDYGICDSIEHLAQQDETMTRALFNIDIIPTIYHLSNLIDLISSMKTIIADLDIHNPINTLRLLFDKTIRPSSFRNVVNGIKIYSPDNRLNLEEMNETIRRISDSTSRLISCIVSDRVDALRTFDENMHICAHIYAYARQNIRCSKSENNSYLYEDAIERIRSMIGDPIYNYTSILSSRIQDWSNTNDIESTIQSISIFFGNRENRTMISRSYRESLNVTIRTQINSIIAPLSRYESELDDLRIQISNANLVYTVHPILLAMYGANDMKDTIIYRSSISGLYRRILDLNNLSANNSSSDDAQDKSARFIIHRSIRSLYDEIYNTPSRSVHFPSVDQLPHRLTYLSWAYV